MRFPFSGSGCASISARCSGVRRRRLVAAGRGAAGSSAHGQSVRGVVSDSRWRRSFATRSRFVSQRMSNRRSAVATTGRVIVDPRIDGAGGNQWRDDDRRDAHAVLLERESILAQSVARIVVQRNGRRWMHRVVEPAVLVVENDQQARVPVGRLPDRRVDGGQQVLAAVDVVPRMLRRPTGIRTTGDVAVMRFDERVRIRVRTLKIAGELRQRDHVDGLDVVQRRNLRDRPDLAPVLRIITIEAVRVGVAVVVEAVADVVVVQEIVERAVRVPESVDALPLFHVGLGRAPVETGGGCTMDEETVRPGRPRQRREPVVAHSECRGELVERLEIVRRVEAGHDVGNLVRLRWGSFGRGRRVAGGETGVVDRRIRLAGLVAGADARELRQDILELVPGSVDMLSGACACTWYVVPS